MAKSIIFGEFNFSTKKGATEEARRRINQYQFGQELDEKDSVFFLSLLTLHPEYLEKRGDGIISVIVEGDFHGNRCLYLHRVDGSKIDFSWVKCIQPPSKRQMISMSFRRAIKEKIIAFRDEQLTFVTHCPVLGIPLTSKNSHVSHIRLTFDEILEEFLSSQNIKCENILIVDPSVSDSDKRGILVDDDLVNKWRSYHNQVACLELVSAQANLQRLNKLS